jgi:hypothetical protein
MSTESFAKKHIFSLVEIIYIIYHKSNTIIRRKEAYLNISKIEYLIKSQENKYLLNLIPKYY